MFYLLFILVLYIYQIRITRKHIPFFQVQLLGTFVTHMIFLDFLFGTDVSQSFFIQIIITITTTTKYSRSQTLLATYIFYKCRSYVALLHI